MEKNMSAFWDRPGQETDTAEKMLHLYGFTSVFHVVRIYSMQECRYGLWNGEGMS